MERACRPFELALKAADSITSPLEWPFDAISLQRMMPRCDRARVGLHFTATQLAISTLTDRILGCLIGGALGDGFGGPYEGQAGPLSFHLSETLEISDDTQLTLATCEAVSNCRRISPDTIAASFLEWYRANRITGMGASTLKALRDLDAGAHWALSGRQGEMGAGNGAAMRVAPLAFVLDPDVDADRTKLRDICRITHHHDEAYIGALAIMGAIRLIAFEGRALDATLPRTIAGQLPDSRVRDRLIDLADATTTTSLGENARRFGSSAYVVDSVPLAIVAAANLSGGGIAALLQTVVEYGGDTDTNASLAGQLYGAAYGLSTSPADLIGRLSDLPLIEEICRSFARSVNSVER